MHIFVDDWIRILKNDIDKTDIVSAQMLRGRADSCFRNCTVYLVMDRSAQDAVDTAIDAVYNYASLIETRGLFLTAKEEMAQARGSVMEEIEAAHDALSGLPMNQRAISLKIE